MKKWIICKFGMYHIQAPHLCKPIGIAFQKQQGNSGSAFGFIDESAFSRWLEKNDLCAFGEGYKKALGINDRSNGLSVLYPVNEKGE